MRAHLGGRSRQSLVAARASLDAAVKGVDANTASALSTQLFFIAEVLDTNIAVRRALTDTSRDATSKDAFIVELFGKKIDSQGLAIVKQISAMRWSGAKDLVQVVEQLAIEAEASAANIAGELDRVEDEIFTASRPGKFFLHHFTERVVENFLAFLNPRRDGAGHSQINRRNAFRETAVAAEERDALDACALRLFECADDVFGFAARRDDDEHVTFFRKTPDLARENFVGMIIVAHGGHELAVRGERDGGVGPTFFAEAAETFRGQMRGVRRAAAIAAGEQFVAGGQAARQDLRRAAQRFLQRREAAGRGDGFFNGALQVAHADSVVIGG